MHKIIMRNLNAPDQEYNYRDAFNFETLAIKTCLCLCFISLVEFMITCLLNYMRLVLIARVLRFIIIIKVYYSIP